MKPTEKPETCLLTPLLALLTGPWTLHIVWVLSTHGPTRFGVLKRQLDGVSSKVLTKRLRMLEEAKVVARHYKPTIPPEVTYSVTTRGEDLDIVLAQLHEIALKWYESPNQDII
ncbi:winged helix-turn-helix transcriptional regulator [Nostoc sp.]|uniref:winged helix-turn-helix transcriptional regulator n=1 Tax=Nostoc sp. TaxID=1180 RepID=UPI002FFCBD75